MRQGVRGVDAERAPQALVAVAQRGLDDADISHQAGSFSIIRARKPVMSPEAAEGGPLAFVHDGDIIDVDMDGRKIELQISDEEFAKRRESWAAGLNRRLLQVTWLVIPK